MPRPRSLTIPAIAAAALAVVDRDGLSALTMREVASELGMRVMSLYRYVKSREELETFIVDLILAELDLNVPDYGPWADKAALLARRVWRAAAAHPRAIPLLLAARGRSAKARAWDEALRTVLASAGYDDARRALAYHTIGAYVFGALQQDEAALTPEMAFEAGLGLVLRGVRTG